MSKRRRRLSYAANRVRLAVLIIVAVGAIVTVDRMGLLGGPPKPDSEKYDGKAFQVTRVIDGDTLDINIADSNGRRTRVRLWGVDTPETVKPDTPVQHFGPEASRFTKLLAAGQTVKLKLVPSCTRDKYGRLLAYVILPDKRMLNRLLIAEGYGYADPRYTHPFAREFRALQRQAKLAGRGLWREVKRSDLPYYYKSLKLPTRRDAE